MRHRPQVAVVGAGFAGLSAAASLVGAGADVVVLDAGALAGGKAGTWREAGYRFDTGPTVLTMRDTILEAFAAVGATCPVPFERPEPQCRYVFPSGRVWDVSHELDATIAGLERHEVDPFLRALARARALHEAVAPTFVHGPPPTPLDLARFALGPGRSASPGSRLPDLLDALRVHGDLRSFFLRFATYVGADPRLAPAVLHNIVWVELGLGSWHPVGGLGAVAAALEAAVVAAGATVRHDLPVQRVRTRTDGRVGLVAGGEEQVVDGVVAAIDRRAALRLVGARPPAERPPSLSALVLLAGVASTAPALAHHTVLFPERYGDEFDDIARGSFARDPTLYVAVSSRSVQGDAPVGAENRYVLVNAPATPVRGAPRDEEEGRDRVLGALERRGLDVAEAAAVRWIGPAEFARSGHRGSLYGDAPHGLLASLRPGHALPAAPRVLVAGGTVHPGGGVPLAVLSGRNAAHALASRLGLTPGVGGGGGGRVGARRTDDASGAPPSTRSV